MDNGTKRRGDCGRRLGAATAACVLGLSLGNVGCLPEELTQLPPMGKDTWGIRAVILDGALDLGSGGHYTAGYELGSASEGLNELGPSLGEPSDCDCPACTAHGIDPRDPGSDDGDLYYMG